MGSGQLSFMFFLYFSLLSFSSSITHPCPKDQSTALLKFKKTLTPKDPLFITCSSYSYTILDLSYINISSTIPLNFDLSYINISSTIPLNFSSHLTTLKLGETELHGIIPESIFHLPNLETLHLYQNDQLSGYFAKNRWNSSASHMELFLSDVNLSDNVPDFRSNSLSWIDLEDNHLQGHLPKSIQNLVRLTLLDLSSNNFSGHVDVSLFTNLKNLWYLSLSYNSISLTNKNKVNVTLPGSLSTLRLAACEVKEIEFLRSAKKFSDLDLSNNKLQGRIPDWAWSNWMFSLGSLNISQNMLTSVDSIPLQSVETFDLRSNLLQGSLPIPPNSIRYFFISHNNLSEEIPSSICNLTSLVMLDLARNNLKGSIPQCLSNISSLEVLDMHRNNLFGTLPMIFTVQSSLRSLNLHGNKLEGIIPRTLANCKDLQVLDIGDNHLIDTFPTWLGTLSKLQVLSLRSNKLHGHIRTLRTMRIIDQTMKAPIYLGENSYYQDSITVATKGLELELVRILTVYTTIDLSSKNFEGGIPSIMGDLIALQVLNFSHNRLQGQIPLSLGRLSVLESLDLSFNQFSGEIPQQLASLTFLASLDLSHNHLQGCIPQGSQFATFENNSYEGNDGLRGFFVSKGCGRDRVATTNYTISGLDDQESNSEFLSDFLKASLMGYGSGLCIGLSIIYFMISTGNLKWLVRIIENLERKIIMRRRRKKRSLRNYRRRNNRV
ncbi:hypothetical protein R3W88_027198 [Solanum pinnatisectum]|uniref:Uncharacterized protein n=1 Tax=Solanum pinnatisectum TaxID=50273 RepID=A0AAV9LFH9_9SOLN|nr:hypothetical protein R3W88_027198 [Solanum pinnatisectum]